MSYNTIDRKLEHLEVALREDVEGPLTTWLECVHLIHDSVPELSIDEVDITTEFLGKRLSAPLIITGMTGGAPTTEEINAALARAAELLGLGLGVGSQRVAIECSSTEYTFSVVRTYAPTVPVIANIGIYEFIHYEIDKINKLIDMINADALAIHLNIAQELTQPEGSHDFKGFLRKLKDVVKEVSVPIIVKEVGFGLSKESAEAMSATGVNYFDVAGAGGTNWVKIEMFRARRRGDKLREFIASQLISWGIPTAASIIEVRNASPEAKIIASGGIRGALDIVKSLRLGADAVGIALPVLKAYFRGELLEYLRGLIYSTKAILLLTGSRNLKELKDKPIVLTDPLKTWVSQRNLKIP